MKKKGKSVKVRRKWGFKPVSRVVESKKRYRRSAEKAEERRAKEDPGE